MRKFIDSGQPIGNGDFYEKAFWLLFAIVASAVAFTFRDYGYSWDEMGQNWRHGLAIIKFYASLGHDLGNLEQHDFGYYGGAFDVFADALVALLPFEPRNARHLANALAGSLCLLGTWKLAKEIFGPETAFWSALLLVLCPPFYGHLFINAKDIPFAAGYVWSLYLMVRHRPTSSTRRFRRCLMLGLAIGLTMGVRVGGIILLFYLALFLLFDLTLTPTPSTSPARGAPIRRENKIHDLAYFALTCATAYATMLLAWPTALLNPLEVPLRALSLTSNSAITESILWNGVRVLSTDLPWNYLPVLFGVELPEAVVVATIPALALSLSLIVSRVGRRDWQRAIPQGMLLLSALFPILWAISAGSTIYDNARHFLFVLPPLMIICANLVTKTAGLARNRGKSLHIALSVLLAAGLGYSTIQMFSIHPYEYAYKNTFGDGIPKAGERFETDYWLTSYREAFRLLEDHARKAAGKMGRKFEEMNFSVAVFGEPGLADEELPPQFKVYFLVEDNPARADYLVVPTRSDANLLWEEFPIIGMVGRRGMTFSVVKASPALANQ